MRIFENTDPEDTDPEDIDPEDIDPEDTDSENTDPEDISTLAGSSRESRYNGGRPPRF